MGKELFDSLKNVHFPAIARGAVVPPYIYEKLQEEENRQKQMDDLRKITISLEQQLKLMEEQLSMQKKENESSKKQARISLVLSILAIVATLISAATGYILSLLGV